ncbi:MAG TPA: PQQ-binding-like beta-propeller repeat protein, partial [Anaerolineales bacterium]|nr:PQQ-binding-like beta-propeller repeat protein [Anaerolineales bacterium]
MPLQSAYVEPGLAAHTGSTISVIISADSSDTAARAVASIGGEVTSDLWLIDAVAAIIPSNHLETLAAYQGISSIVDNKRVATADQPEGNGWVTNRRAINYSQQLESRQDTPAVFLPDGGIFSPVENGRHLIINADGTLRISLVLTGGPFKTTPVVGTDGTIYLTGENKVVYALNSDGSTRWVFRGSAEKFYSGVALGLDGTVYSVDEKRNLYALDGSNGQTLWTLSLGGDGSVRTNATIGPNGNIYVISEKGYLFAINPNRYLMWTFFAPLGFPFRYSPLVSQNGMVYISGEEKHVYAINPDGSQNFEFTTSSKIKAQSALALNGELYVPAENGHLYSLAPEGSIRFVYSVGGDHLRSSPVLSGDDTTIYTAVEEGYLL